MKVLNFGPAKSPAEIYRDAICWRFDRAYMAAFGVEPYFNVGHLTNIELFRRIENLESNARRY